MKSENQTVRFKQPIKIEKPFQCSLPILTALVKEILSFFFWHCGASFGIKWRIWRNKIYFSPLNKPVKSENQIIVQCKQLIKIEKPFYCFWMFSYSVRNSKYSSAGFVVFFFSVFILLLPSKVIIIARE